MIAELLTAVAAAAADAAVRVILLGADGADFCAGADLAALAGMVDAAPEVHRKDAELLGRLFVALRACPRPVVAAVRGRALAGGTGLATACDIVLAHEEARFGFPEVNVGFVPAMVMTMLRRSVGEKRAFELVASGRAIRGAGSPGARPRQPDRCRRHLRRRGRTRRRSAGRGAASSIRLTKRLFYALDASGFRDGIALGAAANVEARATPEFREGVSAIHQGRRLRPMKRSTPSSVATAPRDPRLVQGIRLAEPDVHDRAALAVVVVASCSVS